MKIFIKLRFLGTDFSGYQVQKNARTVQGELCRAAEELFGFRCDVTGCSRTDSGVHANMFCAAISGRDRALETTIPMDKFPRVFNSFLPDDVAVYEAKWVCDEFHPRYDVKYKEYIYKINCSYERDPFEAGRAFMYPYVFSDADIERMRRAAKHLEGTHDFSSYMAQGSAPESTVRTIFYTDVLYDGKNLVFKIAGDGFLYNMVRIIVGTLLSVARGKTDPDDIPLITEAHDRSRAGITVRADGLYLNYVEYDGKDK